MLTFVIYSIKMRALEEKIFSITTPEGFAAISLEVFNFQYTNNAVYQKFCNLLGRTPNKVKTIADIPFLPISFFKQFKIASTTKKEEILFTSSGTTGTQTSKHYVPKLALYERSFKQGFKQFFNSPKDYAILALLPSYLERKGSSLIYMCEHLINKSNHPESGFYLNNHEDLIKNILSLEQQNIPILLIGVSFALLDIAEKYKLKLHNTIVMETGGMKGRRKEMIRKELHEHLKNGFGVKKIYSEYGMTELLSQAYSLGDGIFHCTNTMQIIIREPEDELQLLANGKTGGINVIDLANLYSCSFIATQDLGKKIRDNTYEILGRFDYSDIRGCNLLI